MLLRAALFALAVTLLADCGPPALPAALQYATVSGNVVDAATGQPIAGAVVTIDGALSSGPTGSDGQFAIGTVPNGPWDITALATGYAPYRQPAGLLPLKPGETRQYSITLTRS
ncbi:MAG: carboxypeptidase-like regulatory domain-containing protein [Vulcanimicrobiaceae bacterium]